MLLAIGFTMGRAASSSFYSELLQGRAQGLLMGLLIATGSLARIIAPLVGVYAYELVHSTFILMPAVGILFLICGGLLAGAVARSQRPEK
jgi:MFS family permease